MPISKGYNVSFHHTEHTLLFDPSEGGPAFLTHCGTVYRSTRRHSPDEP
jgi:hypothetical protein